MRNARQTPRQLDTSGLEEILGFSLSTLRQCLYRDFAERFARLRLTPNLYSIVLLIEANPGCRQLEIGVALGILQTNLAKRINLLLQRKLIMRTTDPRDRRARALQLTPRGREFAQQMRTIHAALTRDLIRRIGLRDYQRLHQLLASATRACRRAVEPRT